MADEVNIKDGVEQRVQPVEIIDATDWFLRTTIENIVSHGIEIGVTLTVKGVIVSGMLVGGKKYFEELSKLMKISSQAPNDISDFLGNAWKEYTAIYEQPEGASEDWQPAPIGYVHLMNARFYAPGQAPLPENQGVLWRGKLSSVDGFIIGNFSPTTRP
ncbi:MULTISPECIES: gas vesicle accessory protein GvpU [Rhizobium/Agrobacterium group]|nr:MULTISPECIES: gas vesicle accessory protein GvpU [Rhizobium/Agrobacterium group]MUO27454.1 hypothetical protein [Agrobacterium vitis]MUO42096.1 hypothetical protein [Agrobacterium vitis]MUP09404.1 hypothetical protein [Agrobacterium vitis]